MSKDTPLIYIRHLDGQKFITFEDIIGVKELTLGVPAIEKFYWQGSRYDYVHLTLVRTFNETKIFEVIKDTPFGGVFISVGQPDELLISGPYRPELIDILKTIRDIAKESKWGFVIISGAGDDEIRDVADLCYTYERINDFTKGAEQIKNVTCYRKMATIK